MKERITEIWKESAAVHQATLEANLSQIQEAAQMIVRALRDGHKVLIFGNGGSAADAQHMAAEFVGRFQKERQALPALALSTDSSALTALANDYGVESIFRRQLEALGQAGDVAIGISTSGNSVNVLEAVRLAKQRDIPVISLTGAGGELPALADIALKVPSQVTARVQEAHGCLIHVICELVEDDMSS